jgi:hypothetical protein
MTTGSWTFGQTNYTKSPIHAMKSWSGTDGKTESWAGGTRPKWNSYTMKRRGWTTSNFQNNHGYGVIFDHSGPGGIEPYVGWSANDDLRLLNKLAEKIRGHSFDLGVNIAETRKSYNTVVSNLRSIGKALIHLKHGRVGHAFRQLRVPAKRTKGLSSRDVTGRWLEMQYGWMPLVSQAYEAAKAVEALTGPRVLRFRVSSGSKVAMYDGSQNPGCYTYPVRASYSKSIIAELYEDLALQRSLGLVNPAEILWEIVPYSFVVDWFLPIGSYISAWGVIPHLQGRFLTTTRAGQKAGKIQRLGLCASTNYPPEMTKRDSWFSLTREVSTSLTIPTPTFNEAPKALSGRRIFNAAALIHRFL